MPTHQKIAFVLGLLALVVGTASALLYVGKKEAAVMPPAPAVVAPVVSAVRPGAADAPTVRPADAPVVVSPESAALVTEPEITTLPDSESGQ